jgi:septum formation protein
LESVGVRFHSAPPEIDERVINGEPPQALVCRLALAKAMDVASRIPGRWILAADTIVVIDGRILGKPRDRDEAAAMLGTLTGRTHEVFTGYAILNTSRPGEEAKRFVRSEVFISKLSREEIEAYVRTGEPMDKAGAYAIQGVGAGIVERISGSYTNVVGLPLCEVMRDLKRLRIVDVLGRDGRS